MYKLFLHSVTLRSLWGNKGQDLSEQCFRFKVHQNLPEGIVMSLQNTCGMSSKTLPCASPWFPSSLYWVQGVPSILHEIDSAHTTRAIWKTLYVWRTTHHKRCREHVRLWNIIEWMAEKFSFCDRVGPRRRCFPGTSSEKTDKFLLFCFLSFAICKQSEKMLVRIWWWAH